MQDDYVNSLYKASGNAGTYIALLIALGFVYSAAALLCGRIFAAVYLFAVAAYLRSRGKGYRWVYPIGTIIGSVFSFLYILDPEAAHIPGFIPSFIAQAALLLTVLSIPAGIISGLFFMYSKKINALADYLEHTQE